MLNQVQQQRRRRNPFFHAFCNQFNSNFIFRLFFPTFFRVFCGHEKPENYENFILLMLAARKMIDDVRKQNVSSFSKNLEKLCAKQNFYFLIGSLFPKIFYQSENFKRKIKMYKNS